MVSVLLFFGVCFWYAFVPTAAVSSSPLPFPDGLALELARIVSFHGGDACMVASSRQGKILWNRRVGTITSSSIGSDTLVRIASISKSFTAVALALALQDSPYTMDSTMDDVVRTHLKTQKRFQMFSTLKNNMNMTLGQLASHRSGLRHYATSEEYLYDGEELFKTTLTLMPNPSPHL